MEIGKLTLKRAAQDVVVKKTKPTRSKRRRTVLFQDGLAALSVAAFLFFGATAREVNLLLALAALFGGFVALDYFWGRRVLRRLRVSRTAPDAVFAGEPFYVALEVRNVGKRASWAVVVEDDWAPETRLFDVDALKMFDQPQIAVSNSTLKTPSATEKSNAANASEALDVPKAETTLRPTVYFSQIRGGETRKERYSGVISRRGTRRLTELTASTRFPCGFFRSYERFDAPAEITVFPKTGTLTDVWNVFAGDVVSDATVATGRSSRVPDETLTVRDWRSGDPKKAIHWRATAKRDRLQARDFEERKAQTIFLLLDLFADDAKKTEQNGEETKRRGKNGSFPTFRRWENVELAVSFAATLLQRWARSGDARFFFAVNGDDSTANGESTKEFQLKNSGKAERIENAPKNDSFEKNDKTGNGRKIGKNAKNRRQNDDSVDAPFAWKATEWSEGSDGGALRNFLTRLATATEPRRDRLAEIFAEADPKTLAEAQIFVVSVAPFDFERLNSNDGETRSNRTSQADAVSWANARFVDVSSDVFSEYFIV